LWTAANAGLSNLTVRAIARTSTGTLYAGTANGLFRSTNGASSWTQVTLPIVDLYAVAVDASGGIYAGGGYSTYRSADEGATWANVGPGRWVHSLLVEDGTPRYLYAGIVGGVRVLGAAPPTVTQVSPSSGPPGGGTTVTITGTQFVQSFTQVKFGGIAATSVSVTSGTTLAATTPAGAVGSADVSVFTAGGTGSLAGAFTYAGAPTVTGVAPNTGPATGGTAITLTGTNFVSGATVTVGGTAATGVTVVNATTITATTPAGSAGAATVAVTTTGGTGSLASAFTYLAAPTVTGVAPNTGPATGGTAITLTGTNFVSGATVTVGGTAATGVTVVNATTITATTPAGSAGAATVAVTTTGGTGSLASAFTYLAPLGLSVALAGSGAGRVTSSPTGIDCGVDCGEAFPNGTLVTLTATPTAGVVFTGWSGACAGTGTCQVMLTGPVSVTATFVSTSSSTPTITTVAPASGPTGGGTRVVLGGTNLATTTSVTIGGTPASLSTASDATSIVIITPPGAAGARDIVVTTAQGAVTVAGGFTYNAAATLVNETAGANADTLQPTLNGDGSQLAFVSLADNLVPGDTNGAADVFVRDRTTGSIARVSVASDGTQANGASERPKISADGRFVVFVSAAGNLVPGDTNSDADVFVRDRDTNGDGTFDQADVSTFRVSVASDGQEADGPSSQPDISSDGLWVSFASSARTLVPGDSNGVEDVFLHHWPSGQTLRVSVTTAGKEANGPSRAPSISRGALRAVFASDASNLVDDDGNGVRDVFVHERESGVTARVSTSAGAGADANDASDSPSIDDAGRLVAFQTRATDITGGPSGPAGVSQVVAFVLPPIAATVHASGGTPVVDAVICIPCAIRRLLSGQTQGEPGTDDSTNAEVAGSAPAVIFQARGDDFSDADNNGKTDVYKTTIDPETGDASPPELVSHDAGGNGGDGASQAPAIAGDGRRSAFESKARLTSDSGTQTHVFVRGERLLVAGLSPASKPLDTKQAIVIRGSGFEPGVTVSFGTRLAPKVVRTDSTRLDVDVPPASAAGVVDIVVTNPNGERASLPASFTYLDPDRLDQSDTDGDGLPDPWEKRYGLDPTSASGHSGGGGDPDGDGKVNAVEFVDDTHPRGTFVRYLAEGATTSPFQTRIALANPSATTPVTALLRFQKADGTEQSAPMLVPPQASRRVRVNELPGMVDAEFATVIESDGPLAVDRQMSWDAVAAYGSHAEAALKTPGLVWYLAEGATHSGFDLFYLLQNPSASSDAFLRVRYLLPSGEPLEKTYVVGPKSRFNIWVNWEQFPDGSHKYALANTDVSAVLEVTNGVPIIVERAMYLNRPGQPFAAGHESAGVPAPALTWFLAEGATGELFDEFVLLANPNAKAAEATVTYLLESGTVYTRPITVPGNSRQNIWVDFETPDGTTGFPLARAELSTKVEVTNGVPIVVERAMWWPGASGEWYEAHNSPGSTVTGTLWALADGEASGPPRFDATYVLIANTSAHPADVQLTVLREEGPPLSKAISVLGTSRRTLDMVAEFPELIGQAFGVLVESLGTTPAQIVVERAMYNNALGVPLAAGNNLLATRLR
jgi:Tol biopolymer transport system component